MLLVTKTKMIPKQVRINSFLLLDYVNLFISNLMNLFIITFVNLGSENAVGKKTGKDIYS
jgi:hypothetical protein